MSLIQPYPHEERRKTRDLLKRLDGMANDVMLMAKGEKPFDKRFVAGLAALTDTSDLEGQYNALNDLRAGREKAHLDHLVLLAPDDLTAFAEVMNPHEPPPRHLIFVSERLMEIEAGDRDRLMLSMPPGHAKDLDVDTPVMMGDGGWKRLGDVDVGDQVITMHGRPREVLAVHDQGIRPVLKIVTETGRVVRAHPEHLFLTPWDWVKAEDLQVGFTLALPKTITPTAASIMGRDEFALAGYFMARAVVTGRAYSRLHRITTKFRCDDPVILADIKAIGARMGFRHTQTREATYGREAVMVTFDKACRDWLEEAGLWQAKKDDVRVPDWVFNASDDEIASFLGAIISCDATFRPAPNAHTGKQKKLMLTIKGNAGLAQDIQRLFLRIGIKASCIASLHHNYNYDTATFYKVEVISGADQHRIAKRLRIIGSSRRFWDLPMNIEAFEAPDFHNDKIVSIAPDGDCQTRCLTVEEDHSFLAEGLVVHNSTYASRYYPAWYLGRRERRIYLQAGHSKDFARTEFGRKTKDLVESDAYRRVFPGVQVRFDAKAADDWILTNGNRYVTKGVGEGISGFRSTNNAVDDPYKDFKAAQSPAQRKTVWDWFVNDFMTRLLPQGNAFIISTRWHIDDVIGRLEDMQNSGELAGAPWDIINLPVFCNDPETDPLNRDFGEPIWPDFYTKEVLLRQKSISSASNWACLYDGNPIPDEGNIIKAEWLTGRYKVPPTVKQGSPAAAQPGTLVGHNGGPDLGDPDDSNQGGANPQGQIYRRTVVSVDSAEKETERADFTAITVWRDTLDRRHYLVDAHRERMEFPKLLQRCTEFALTWGADFILMETKGAGNQFIQHFAALSPEEHPPFVVVPIDPGRDGKIFRMDAVTPVFMQGRVVLPERAPWLSHLERELLQFPGGKNDDYPDSVSQYLKWSRDSAATRRGSKKLRGTQHARGR